MNLNLQNAVTPKSPIDSHQHPIGNSLIRSTERYSRAGLAHSAAETMMAKSGGQWQMDFRPRSLNDDTPFVVAQVAPSEPLPRKAVK